MVLLWSFRLKKCWRLPAGASSWWAWEQCFLGTSCIWTTYILATYTQMFFQAWPSDNPRHLILAAPAPASSPSFENSFQLAWEGGNLTSCHHDEADNLAPMWLWNLSKEMWQHHAAFLLRVSNPAILPHWLKRQILEYGEWPWSGTLGGTWLGVWCSQWRLWESNYVQKAVQKLESKQR
jgi:hypothetical protein